MDIDEICTDEREEREDILHGLVLRRKTKRLIISVALIVVLLTTIAVSAWVSGSNQAKSAAEARIKELEDEIADLINNPIVVNPVAPEINLDIIKNEITDIGELATVQYLFTNAARYTDSKQIGNWEVPFTEKSFTLKWDGVIKAGIDLEQVTIDVNKLEKKIIVKLPAAQILSYEVDNNSIQVLDEKNNIFNNITVNDKVQLDVATEQEMKERAVDNGLLENAQKNAEDIIRRLLTANSAIGDSYTIEFASAQ